MLCSPRVLAHATSLTPPALNTTSPHPVTESGLSEPRRSMAPTPGITVESGLPRSRWAMGVDSRLREATDSLRWECRVRRDGWLAPGPILELYFRLVPASAAERYSMHGRYLGHEV